MAKTPQQKSFPWLWISVGCGSGCLLLVIVAILAAIALPTFLNQANRAKEQVAKQLISSILSKQQDYFSQKAQFTTATDALEVVIPADSESYEYQITTPKVKQVLVTAIPRRPGLKSFAGSVYALKSQSDPLLKLLCQSDKPSDTPPIMPQDPKNPSEVECLPPAASAETTIP